MEVHLRPSNVAPLHLPDLRRLQHLSTFTASYTQFSGLLTAEDGFDIEKLPSSLQRLRLHFANAPSVLQDRTPGVSHLQYVKFNHVFPNLREITVSGHWKKIYHDFFVNLPRCLESLTLQDTSSSTDLSILDLHLIMLPPALERLDIPIIQLGALKGRAIAFPESLTFLSIVCAPEDVNAIQSHLPSHLLTFKLRSKGAKTAMDWSSSWRFLPRTLTSLSTFGNNDNAANVKYLPDTLKSLQLIPGLMNLEVAAALPRNLTQIGCGPWLDGFGSDVLAQLPRSLTKYPYFWDRCFSNHIEELSDDQNGNQVSAAALRTMLSLLPTSLTQFDARNYVDFGVAEEEILSAIPSRKLLRTYITTSLSDSLIQQLPNSLTELHCGEIIDAVPNMRTHEHPLVKARAEVRREAQLKRSFSASISLLPASLTNITITGNTFANDGALGKLPKHLQTLHWRQMDSSSRFTYQLLFQLPKTLTEFNWDTMCAEVTNEWLLPLQELPSLTNLTLSSLSSRLTSAHLPHLPKNLIKYSTAISGILHEDHLWHLNATESLRVLHISSDSFCGLTNDGTKRLPRNLISLKLPECPYLTSWCTPDMPPRLLIFSLPGVDQPPWWPRNPVNRI